MADEKEEKDEKEQVADPDPNEPDTLSLTDEELNKRLAEEAEAEPGDDQGKETPSKEKKDKPGDETGKATETSTAGKEKEEKATVVEPAVLDIPKELLDLVPKDKDGNPVYKNLNDILKTVVHQRAVIDRQGAELGQLRPKVQRPTPKAAEEGKQPEEITDEMIHKAFYEDMNPREGYQLLRERERREEAKANAEATEQERYVKALREANESLGKAIPGFFSGNPEDPIGELGKNIIEYGITNGYIASAAQLEAIDADPVNGPALIRQIHHQMQKDDRISEIEKERTEKLKEAEKRSKEAADNAAKKINAAAKGASVMPAGSGSGTVSGKEYGDLSTEQILKLSDDEIEKALEQVQ